MVVKMKLVSIIGSMADMDRVLEHYVLNSNIHLEYTLEALPKVEGFSKKEGANIYERQLRRVIEALETSGIGYHNTAREQNSESVDEIVLRAEQFICKLNSIKSKIVDLQYAVDHCDIIINTLQPIVHANLEIDQFLNLKFLRFRFGRLPIDSYDKWETYLSDSTTYFYVASKDNNFVWGFYFVTEDDHKRIDDIFSSMYFERVRLEGDATGSPAQIIEKEVIKREKLKEEITELENEAMEFVRAQRSSLICAYARVKYHYDFQNIYRYCAYTKNSFYLIGWMEEPEALRLANRMRSEKTVSVMVEHPGVIKRIKPPTKLKNFKIFKPFEEFVRMYGTPDYYEADPTLFLSISYILMFGMMFGDIGHGLCLTLVATAMVLLKKGGFLPKILIPVGISSTIFGFLYGVFFGFEGKPFAPLWFTPMASNSNMNRILMTTVGMGVVVIIMSFMFNIFNGIKQKDVKKVFLSHNGLAGFIFYCTTVFLALGIVKHSLNFVWLPVAIIFTTLAIIFLRNPLSNFCQRKNEWKPEHGFFLESTFELFEILLSYITNTVSFVRVGAFALNHAGMMSVVLLFMSSMNNEGSLLVAIFGNIVVISIEGLIVGIQVLRLGFYEMFSRFFDGTGREFKPIKEQ